MSVFRSDLPIVSNNKHRVLRIERQMSKLRSFLVSHCEQKNMYSKLLAKKKGRDHVKYSIENMRADIARETFINRTEHVTMS